MDRSKLQEQIARLARDDADFRRRLVADPLSALAERFGGGLLAFPEPGGFRLEVLEETADVRYIVLPYEGADAGRLDEAQLDQVVGASNHPPPPPPPPPTQTPTDPTCAGSRTG